MVSVFHHIGEPTDDHFTNSLEQILNYKGQITFDGAYKEVYEHRKALAPRKPILFVQGGTVGTTGVCTWRQIAKLADLGFELGWHGWSHRRLTELSRAEIMQELTGPYKLYAYPHGDFDEQSKELVKVMGYTKAYSTTQGNEDKFSLRREYI